MGPKMAQKFEVFSSFSFCERDAIDEVYRYTRSQSGGHTAPKAIHSNVSSVRSSDAEQPCRD